MANQTNEKPMSLVSSQLTKPSKNGFCERQFLYLIYQQKLYQSEPTNQLAHVNRRIYDFFFFFGESKFPG